MFKKYPKLRKLWEQGNKTDFCKELIKIIQKDFHNTLDEKGVEEVEDLINWAIKEEIKKRKYEY